MYIICRENCRRNYSNYVFFRRKKRMGGGRALIKSAICTTGCQNLRHTTLYYGQDSEYLPEFRRSTGCHRRTQFQHSHGTSAAGCRSHPVETKIVWCCRSHPVQKKIVWCCRSHPVQTKIVWCCRSHPVQTKIVWCCRSHPVSTKIVRYRVTSYTWPCASGTL